MFTGIIEYLGRVESVIYHDSNMTMSIKSPFVEELQVDQSIAHNGVCLTVTSIKDGLYTVDLIKETLDKSNFGQIAVGDPVNLERCLKVGARLDGHMVQGHVDATAKCLEVAEEEGSWRYTFEVPSGFQNLIVSKGSICINGVSLTVVDPSKDSFSVCIIPYTYDHTTFHQLRVGDAVNLEFDILGKYINRYLESRK